MGRVKIIWCGVTVLALLCFSSVPTVHAQALDNIILAVKIKIVLSTRGGSVDLETEKDADTTVVKFEAIGPPNGCGGFDYNLVDLLETGDGNQCTEAVVGIISTCDGERTAIGSFSIFDEPRPGLEGFCRFIAAVKTNSAAFKTTGAYCEIFDPNTLEVFGTTSKLSLKGKEKDPQKLLDCTPP